MNSSKVSLPMSEPSDAAPTLVENPLLAALGQAVYIWSAVEWLEGDLLAFLLGAHQGLAQIVTKTVSGSTITDWLRTLATIRFKTADTEQLHALLTRIDEARAQRNAYVHGLWAPGPVKGTALVTTIRWERAEVMKRELVTLQDLMVFADEARELYAELKIIGQHLGFPEAAYA